MEESETHGEPTPDAPKELDQFGEYCFETDRLALKGNSDYLALMRTLVVLQGQRAIAVQNMEKLLQLKTDATQQPLEFVEKLQQGQQLDFPQAQTVAEIPDIDWSRYGVTLPPERPANTSANNSDSETCRDRDGKLLVRGREFNQKKPETFNQLWTPEEQKRLEELLVTHPPEQVEMERFRKIARALGNRTPLQVQSRVQKYFIKLQKAGLPVPGRTYNFMQYSSNRKSGHRHQRNNRYLFPSSTFFASATPPVYMNDLDEGGDLSGHGVEPRSPLPAPAAPPETLQVSDEEDVVESSKNTEDYAELMWLKLVRKTRQRTVATAVHRGYKCDRCAVEPIVGVRWHCRQCRSASSSSDSVDFCGGCVLAAASRTGQHQTGGDHRLTPILRPTTDTGEHHGASYLQTNFMSDT